MCIIAQSVFLIEFWTLIQPVAWGFLIFNDVFLEQRFGPLIDRIAPAFDNDNKQFFTD